MAGTQEADRFTRLRSRLGLPPDTSTGAALSPGANSVLDLQGTQDLAHLNTWQDGSSLVRVLPSHSCAGLSIAQVVMFRSIIFTGDPRHQMVPVPIVDVEALGLSHGSVHVISHAEAMRCGVR